jgi:hypothetical protein
MPAEVLLLLLPLLVGVLELLKRGRERSRLHAHGRRFLPGASP